MSLSRVIHHSHLFTRLEIYHHIYFKSIIYVKVLFSVEMRVMIIIKTFHTLQKDLSGAKWFVFSVF